MDLQVFNTGTGDVNPGGQASIKLFASPSSSPGVGTIPIQTYTFANKGLSAGGQTDTAMTFVVPLQTVTAGNYFLQADVDSNNDIPESNENNNFAVSAAAVPIVLEAGQVGGRSNVTLKFVTPDGTPVTLALAKGGTATVDVVGDNTLDIQVTGNDPAR